MKFESQLQIVTAAGVPPFTVNQTAAVINLNADLLDGQHGSFYQNAGNLNAGTLLAARLPAFTGGDVTSTAGAVALTLANSGVGAGTYRSVTVDAKGRVTAGTNPTTLAGYGITDALNTSGTAQTKSGNLTLSGQFTQTGEALAVDACARVHSGNIEAFYQLSRRIQSFLHLGSTTVLEIEVLALGGYAGEPKRTTWRLSSRSALYVTRTDEHGGVGSITLKVLNDTSVPDANGQSAKYVVGLICGSGSGFLMYYMRARFVEDTVTSRWVTIAQMATATPTTVSGSAMTYSGGWAASAGYTDTSFTEVITDAKARQLTLTAATGTAPMLVSSTTLVSNLNSDFLDGQHGSYFEGRDTTALGFSTGTLTLTRAAGNLTVSLDGRYLPLTGGTLTGQTIVTQGISIRFPHANQLDTNDGTISAGVFGTGMNIVGVRTVAAAGRVVRIWGALLTDVGATYIHSGNVGDYALPITGGTVTGNSGVLRASTNDARFDIRTGTAGAWLDIRSETLGYAAVNLYGSTVATGRWSAGMTGGNSNYRITSGAQGAGTVFMVMNSSTNATNFPNALQQGGNQVVHAGNLASYVMRYGGSPGVDLNTLTTAGVYRINNTEANRPNDWGQLLVMYGGSDTITQIYGYYFDGTLKTRSGNPPNVGGGGAWTAWRTLLADHNYSSYALPLTGGTITGQLSVNGTTASDILRLYTTGSTVWKLGVTDAYGSALNITADFGSFTINKTNGNVTTPGAFVGGNFSGPGTGLTGTAASLTAGAVPWSGVTGKPTTLAGYGITDALNTSGTAQTKSGNLTVNSALTSGGAFYAATTVQYSNRQPIYTIYYGGGQDLAWKKIADVIVPSGLYRGVTFKIDVVDNQGNFGFNSNCFTLTYFASCIRSSGVQDNLNNATVTGPVADYVRVVKTATGVYELQIRQLADWQTYVFTVEATINSGGSVTYVTSPVNGSTTGTIYTATATAAAGWTSKLANIAVAGVSSFGGQITSTVATGTAPLVIASTTAVTNLNSDLLDGQHGSYFENRDTTAVGFSGGTLTLTRAAGNLTVNLDGRYLPLTGGTVTGELTISTGAATGLRVNSPSGTQGFWLRVGYDSNGTATPVASAFNTMLQSSGSSSGTFSIVCGNTKVASISTGAVNSLVALQQGGNQVLHAGNVSTYALPIGGGTVTGNLAVNGTLTATGIAYANGGLQATAGLFTGPLIVNNDNGVRASYDNGGSFAWLYGYGVEFGRVTSYVRPNTNRSATLFVGGGAINNNDWLNIDFYSSGRFTINNNAILHAGNFNSYAMLTTGIPSGSDQYVNFRVIRNSAASPADGMFIGYGNASSGRTRIYGEGSTSGHFWPDSSGNLFRSDGVAYIHSSNVGNYIVPQTNYTTAINASGYTWIRIPYASVYTFNSGQSPVEFYVTRSIYDNSSTPYGGPTAKFVIQSMEWHNGQQMGTIQYGERGDSASLGAANWITHAKVTNMSGGGYWVYMRLRTGTAAGVTYMFRRSLVGGQGLNLAAIEATTDPGGAATIYYGFNLISAGTEARFYRDGNMVLDAGTYNGYALPLTGGTLTGALTATSFSGAGTGLTGTASSLTAGSANAIADGAVSTTAKLANSVVTYAKIQNVAVSSVLGNSSASVAQAPQALSMATLAGMLSGQTMNINGSSASCTGNAATATSSPLLSALSNYVWSASTLPTGYNQGIQASFVSGSQGFQNYGSVVTVKTYSSGGGTLQLYVPYSPTYGGTGMQVRFGNYDVSNGNSWTSWKTLLASDNYTSYSPSLTGSGASGTWGISITGSSTSCSGNAATATNLSANRTNWVGNGVITAVVGQLAWKNYNNGHTIFDASAGTSPSGTAVNNANAQVAWTGTYPTLMGWNGSSTYGVRVDSARVADSAATATNVAASGITGQVGMWTSAARPGPYRLYRRDANDGYSVQTYWTGSRWRLYGYNADTAHADTHVGYADSAGSASSASSATNSTQLNGQAASYYENRDTTAVGISAGTLTLTRAAGNLTTTIGGRVVAWCEFNGNFASTGSPNAAFNVSSITKNATGDYTINFTSALANTNYVVAGYARVDTTNNTTNYNLYIGVARRSTAKTTTSCRIGCEWVNSTLFDAESVGVAFIAA